MTHGEYELWRLKVWRHYYDAVCLICCAVIMLASCRRSPDPPPKPTPAPTVALVGGLGGSRMDAAAAMVGGQFPGVNVVDFGDNNAYLVDIGAYLLVNAQGKIIMIGHSKGAWGVCRAAAFLYANNMTVDLMVLYDAVSVGSFELTITPNVRRCIHYKAGIPTPFIWRATINGDYEEQVIAGKSHNQIPDDPTVLRGTSNAIAAVVVRRKP